MQSNKSQKPNPNTLFGRLNTIFTSLGERWAVPGSKTEHLRAEKRKALADTNGLNSAQTIKGGYGSCDDSGSAANNSLGSKR